ncbi:uncharacterized protein [Physcomitrium patens]|uniref:uncharacterized protein n=1 Tax=Physcomitrium patens TaxID=3218 RepID=UPI003CCD2CD4
MHGALRRRCKIRSVERSSESSQQIFKPEGAVYESGRPLEHVDCRVCSAQTLSQQVVEGRVSSESGLRVLVEAMSLVPCARDFFFFFFYFLLGSQRGVLMR